MSSPIENNIDWSKSKAFADDKINVIQKLKFLLNMIENIVGKGENAGYQHFLLFPQCFLHSSLSASLRVEIRWSQVKHLSELLVFSYGHCRSRSGCKKCSV